MSSQNTAPKFSVSQTELKFYKRIICELLKENKQLKQEIKDVSSSRIEVECSP